MFSRALSACRRPRARIAVIVAVAVACFVSIEQARAEARIAKKAAKDARKAEKAAKKALDGGLKPKKKKKLVEPASDAGVATEAVIIPLKDVAKA